MARRATRQLDTSAADGLRAFATLHIMVYHFKELERHLTINYRYPRIPGFMAWCFQIAEIDGLQKRTRDEEAKAAANESDHMVSIHKQLIEKGLQRLEHLECGMQPRFQDARLRLPSATDGWYTANHDANPSRDRDAGAPDLRSSVP